MPSTYPGADDIFTEPSSPGSTALSSAGTGSRNHTQHHRDLGDAVEAIEANAALLTHDHSGGEARPTSKLAQANTHESADTDSSTSALHHTIGTGANQSAAGNHTHTQATSHSSPDTDTATSALHHTLGTGANQAAAGNHTHSKDIIIVYTSNSTFTKASHPGLHAVDVEVIGGGGGSAGIPATNGSQYAIGGGGAGGAYARGQILASSLGTNETVTVGAAGSAGSAGANDGGAGGNSSFGAHLTAGGGQGGDSIGVLVWGSSGSIAFNRTGGAAGGTGLQVGVPGMSHRSAGSSVNDGFGGTALTDVSPLDGLPSGGPYGMINFFEFSPGESSTVTNITPKTGLGKGSGASGQSRGPSSSSRAGSAGSAGIVIVRLIF